MKKSFRLVFAVVLTIFSQSSFSTLLFNFTYADGVGASGFGTGHANGAARRTALESAAGDLGAYFGNNATLNITVNASQTDGGGALASAGTSYFLVDDSFQQGIAQQEVLTGAIGGGSQHGSMTWDFGFNYDLDDSVSGGLFDFKSVAMHELTHVLGFSSLIGSDGETRLGGGASNVWGDFDQYLVDGDDGTLIDSATKDFINSQLPDLTGGTGTSPETSGTGVYFNGANAVAANGGNLIPIWNI